MWAKFFRDVVREGEGGGHGDIVFEKAPGWGFQRSQTPWEVFTGPGVPEGGRMRESGVGRGRERSLNA